MSVLTIIRKKSSVFGTAVLGTILVGFILSSGILNLSAVISKVYKKAAISLCDTKIDKEKYDLYKNFFRKQYSHSEYSESDLKKIVEEKLIADEIYNYQIKKIGIAMSTSEIVDIVQGDHISYGLRSIKLFHDSSGSFNKYKLIDYLQNLSNKSLQEQQTWSNVEKSIVEARKNEKIENIFSYACNENSIEKKMNSNLNSEERIVKYIFIPNNKIEKKYNLEISEDDLREYYNKNNDEFMESDSYIFKYINVDYKITELDLDEFYRDIEEIISELPLVENAEEFAKANSDVADSVFVELSEKDIEKLIASDYTKVGDVLRPNFSKNFIAGCEISLYRILKEKSENRYAAIKITKIFKPTYEMKNRLDRSVYQNNNTKYKKKDFEKLAENIGTSVNEVVVTDTNIDEISSHLKTNFTEIVNYVNKTSTKRILDPIYIENKGYLLLSYIEKKSGKIESFEVSKPKILEKLKMKKIKANLISEYSESSLENFISKNEESYEKKDARISFFDNNGLSDNFVGSVFGTKKNNIGITYDKEGFYIFEVKEINKVKKDDKDIRYLYRKNLDAALVILANVRYK